jgi:hypothetical protein
VTVANIAEAIKRLLESLRHRELAAFLADWPREYRSQAVQAAAMPAAALPVLRWLPNIAAGHSAFAGELIASLCHAAESMTWRQTYSAKETDPAFLDNYGWSEIMGDGGPIAAGRLACGVLLLGPSTHYPRHRHAAEEIYLPLRGTASWQQGDSIWRERSPGTIIHHAGDEPHAMRTGPDPMLALYLWRGAGLRHQARLDCATR